MLLQYIKRLISQINQILQVSKTNIVFIQKCIHVFNVYKIVGFRYLQYIFISQYYAKCIFMLPSDV